MKSARNYAKNVTPFSRHRCFDLFDGVLFFRTRLHFTRGKSEFPLAIHGNNNLIN